MFPYWTASSYGRRDFGVRAGVCFSLIPGVSSITHLSFLERTLGGGLGHGLSTSIIIHIWGRSDGGSRKNLGVNIWDNLL